LNATTLQALYESVKGRDPAQPEFLQAVEEVRDACTSDALLPSVTAKRM
jgi:hypothetical protein